MEPPPPSDGTGGHKRSFDDTGLSIDTQNTSNDGLANLTVANILASDSKKRQHSINVDSPNDGGNDSAFYSREDSSSTRNTPRNGEFDASESQSPDETLFAAPYQPYSPSAEGAGFSGIGDFSSAAAIDPFLTSAPIPYCGPTGVQPPSSQSTNTSPVLYANTMLPPNHPLATPEMRRAQHPPDCTGCPICLCTTNTQYQGTVAPSALANGTTTHFQVPEQFTLFPFSSSYRNSNRWPGNNNTHGSNSHTLANHPLNSSSQNSDSNAQRALYGRRNANPQIRLAPVDTTCSYVICDAKTADTPILHCSAGFTSLTGYTLPEIIGRNCRFLQTPNGLTSPYSRPRENCVDLDSVTKIKKALQNREEIQITLINYRKGGHPFVNILTVIPLRDLWGEVYQYIGLQVDAVETPEGIKEVHSDGSYTMDYRRKSTSLQSPTTVKTERER